MLAAAGHQSFARADPRQRPLALAAETALLTLVVILAWLMSATFVSPAWSLIALANYLWMVTLLFRIEPRATVLALPELVNRASTIVALIFVEHGSPIPELATVGTAGPGSSAYVFYMLIFFAAFAAAFRIIVGPPGRLGEGPLTPLFDRYANWIATAVVLVVGFLILWLLLRGLSSGFPLLAGIDRFVYRRLLGDKITVYTLNLKFVILFVLGIVAFRLPAARALRWSAGAATAMLLIIYFLFADKFFTQLVGLAGFIAPYLYYNHAKVRRYLAVYITGGVMALGVVFSITWYIYSNGGQISTAATMERVSGRVVGQGELWYLQTRLGSPLLTWDGSFVRRNIEALKVQEIELYAVQQSLGPHYFSNRYAPDWLRNSLRRNAGTVTYTAALEPLGLAVFGWIGLAGLTVAMALLVALSVAYIAFAISSRSVISALFASYITVQLRVALNQGAPWVIASVFSLKWLSIILVIEIALFALGVSQRRARRLDDGSQWRRSPTH